MAEYLRFRYRLMPTALDTTWEHRVTNQPAQADPLIADAPSATPAAATSAATRPLRTTR